MSSQVEVRFTFKGESVETTFGLLQKDAKFFLVPITDQDQSRTVELRREDGLFTLLDYSFFSEPKEVIDERLVGISELYMDYSSQGVEDADNQDLGCRKPGYGPNDIYVENKPFSLAQLLEMIENGDLELSPSFQRNFIWDKTRQSRLIESILLGLPLPSIYLSQYDDGRLTIVDGLQRISTIKEFLDGKLVLCNMEYLTECNGKKYTQLETVLPLLQLRRFKQAQIMCFVIDYRSPSKLKFDLFRRLNTGGKPLNNQEIRNCLSRGHLQETLKAMASSTAFKKATDNSVKDTRLVAQELALRFIYFYDQYKRGDPVANYNGDMDATLDDYVDILNLKKKEELSCYIKLYEDSLNLAYNLFGSYAFRKVGTDYKSTKKSPVNKLLILVFTVLLACHKDSYKKFVDDKDIGFLTPYLVELLDTKPKLFFAITWSTNSKNNIGYVFQCIKEQLFDKYLCYE